MTVTMHADASRLRDLVERCSNTSYADLPDRTVATARDSLLDWLGCAAAGAQTSEAQAYAKALAPSAGTSFVLGSAQGLHWRDAIEFNALHGHILDFDDMLPALSAHPSAAMLPALIVEAELLDATVEEVLVALVVGIEVGAWVGARILPQHYDAGWHATGTIGAIAAAASLCRLRSLAPEQWVTAIDLACTQASGLKALFGTLGKPLHAANAASSGARAARLATETVSDGSGLLGANGFIANYSVRAPQQATDSPTETTQWAVEGMLYKTYASCFMTQSSVDAGKWVRTEFSGQGVTNVLITASPQLQGVCTIEDPTTPNEAKFSLRGTFALAAAGHDLSSEDAFRPDNMSAGDYRDIHTRTAVAFDDGLVGNEPRLSLTVTTASGNTVTRGFDRGQPAADLLQRRRQLLDKFHQQTRNAVSPAIAEQIVSGSGSLIELIATLNPLLHNTTISKESAHV